MLSWFLVHPVPGLLERHARPRPPREPLTEGETRVLRYLPTPEIVRELSVSVNTVRTHIRHLSPKLGVHRRTEAVARARALGLLAPIPVKASRNRSRHGRLPDPAPWAVTLVEAAGDVAAPASRSEHWSK